MLAVSPRTRCVTRDTSSTPAFLGLTAPGGLWEQLGGRRQEARRRRGRRHRHRRLRHLAREPELLRPHRHDGNGRDGKLDYQQIPGWHGKCTPGESFNASHVQPEADRRALLQRRLGRQRGHRGRSGRGSSTRRATTTATARTPPSTAGGNDGVAADRRRQRSSARSAAWRRARASRPTRPAGRPRTRRPASGFTPRPRRRHRPGRRRRRRRDQLLDQRHRRPTSLDPVEIAFLFAADAGVFVAASAGNSGPTTSTVAHPSPWITTVAAGTHNRDGQGSVTLGNGATYTGASVATPVGPTPLIDSTAAGLPGADPTTVALCYAAVDNGGDGRPRPGEGRRQDRGLRPRRQRRVNKSLAVQEAGGVGMILVNDAPTARSTPTSTSSRRCTSQTPIAPRVKAYAATAGATATINAVDDRLQRAGAVHGVVLVARPAARGRRRPAEAGRDRPGPGHPRRGRASGQRRPRLQPATAARRCRARTSPASRALLKDLHPGLVADGDQVGADDHRRTDVLDGPNTNPLRDLPPGCGPRAAEQRGRSGPRLRHRLQRLARLPVRHDDGRQPGVVHRAQGRRLLDSTRAT